jgi:hypothetical protein
MTRQRLDPVKDADLIRYAEQHIFELPACPHSWLFPKCAAVVHHGIDDDDDDDTQSKYIDLARENIGDREKKKEQKPGSFCVFLIHLIL